MAHRTTSWAHGLWLTAAPLAMTAAGSPRR
jgi:hypothetical protein